MIEDAKYLNDYKIELSFNDGKSNVIDFRDFLSKAKNPMTRKYLDISNFKKFSLDYGDLHWNDFELCFPIWDLYSNNI